ncbi:MAG TPA: acyl transferase, partial [Flavobacteriales bacterium]|nr:acyl transferase [Flavobacteriales bacterium]
LTRAELHTTLRNYFGNRPVFSEYGMTELLSQAWYDGRVFKSPPWMKVLVRGKNDPMAVNAHGSGGLNIIDLANVYSCSFIATGDAGFVYPDGSFNVHGRLDNQDIRGCNLLYEDA